MTSYCKCVWSEKWWPCCTILLVCRQQQDISQYRSKNANAYKERTYSKSFISVRQAAGLYLSPSLSVVIHSIDFFSALFCACLSGFWSPSRYLAPHQASISLTGHFLWISHPAIHPRPDLPPRLLAILCWLFPWLHHFWLSLVRSDFSILVGRWMKMWGEFWWSAFVFFKTRACVMLLVVLPCRKHQVKPTAYIICLATKWQLYNYTCFFCLLLTSCNNKIYTFVTQMQ